MGNSLPVNLLMFFEIEIKPTRYDVTLNQGLRMRIFLGSAWLFLPKYLMAMGFLTYALYHRETFLTL